MTDRATFLSRIARARQSGDLPAALADLPPREPPAHVSDAAALLDSFTRELTAVGGRVSSAETPAQAVEMLLDVLSEGEGKEVLAWPVAELPIAGLQEAVRRAGYTILDPRVPADLHPRREALARLEQASAGITGAWGGLADTGSLVISSGPARPRFASLLPPMHIALLSRSALYPTMAAFLTARPDAISAGSNLLFITGPSRTADIELTLTTGVHGPKALHVIVVPPGGPG